MKFAILDYPGCPQKISYRLQFVYVLWLKLHTVLAMPKQSMVSVQHRVRTKTRVTKKAKRQTESPASQLQIQGEGTGSKLNGQSKSKGMQLDMDKDKSKSMPLDMAKGKSKSAAKQHLVKFLYKKRLRGGPGGTRKPGYVSVDVILQCAVRS